MTDSKIPESKPKKFTLSEDWLAVLIAFGLILLAALKIIGENGIKIVY